MIRFLLTLACGLGCASSSGKETAAASTAPEPERTLSVPTSPRLLAVSKGPESGVAGASMRRPSRQKRNQAV
jgi:hypothetical protein